MGVTVMVPRLAAGCLFSVMSGGVQSPAYVMAHCPVALSPGRILAGVATTVELEGRPHGLRTGSFTGGASGMHTGSVGGQRGLTRGASACASSAAEGQEPWAA